jgi:hypothetical protein
MSGNGHNKGLVVVNKSMLKMSTSLPLICCLSIVYYVLILSYWSQYGKERMQEAIHGTKSIGKYQSNYRKPVTINKDANRPNMEFFGVNKRGHKYVI